MWPAVVLAQALLVLAAVSPAAVMAAAAAAAAAPSAATATAAATAPKLYHFRWYVSEDEKREGAPEVELSFPGHGSTRLQYLASVPARRVRRVCKVAAPHAGPLSISMKGRNGGVHYTFQVVMANGACLAKQMNEQLQLGALLESGGGSGIDGNATAPAYALFSCRQHAVGCGIYVVEPDDPEGAASASASAHLDRCTMPHATCKPAVFSQSTWHSHSCCPRSSEEGAAASVCLPGCLCKQHACTPQVM